jgi:bidirectional [NiFe] hydrogenase diaphorase subunit
MIILIIDNIEIKAKKGSNLLWTALDHGFYIPNLCTLRNAEFRAASCRLCFVELTGKNHPIPSCVTTISDGMIVKLNTEKVRRIRNTAFELLLSNHPTDCAHCEKNRNCALQNIASKLGLKLKSKRLPQILRTLPLDNSHPLFSYNPNKCVLCGRCIQICKEQGTGALDFAFRGIETKVTSFANTSLSEACPSSCLACVAVCPVGSLILKKRLIFKHKTAGRHL